MKLQFKEWLEAIIPMPSLVDRDIYKSAPAVIQFFPNGLKINDFNLSLQRRTMMDLTNTMSYVPAQPIKGSISVTKHKGLNQAIVIIKDSRGNPIGHFNLDIPNTSDLLNVLEKAA